MIALENQSDLHYQLELSGVWLYDNIKPMPVKIYKLDFDFYFELDKGYLEEDEKPILNSEGHQYVVTWKDEDLFSFNSDPSGGCLSLDEAITLAESIVKQQIKWN